MKLFFGYLGEAIVVTTFILALPLFLFACLVAYCMMLVLGPAQPKAH